MVSTAEEGRTVMCGRTQAQVRDSVPSNTDERETGEVARWPRVHTALAEALGSVGY